MAVRIVWALVSSGVTLAIGCGLTSRDQEQPSGSGGAPIAAGTGGRPGISGGGGATIDPGAGGAGTSSGGASSGGASTSSGGASSGGTSSGGASSGGASSGGSPGDAGSGGLPGDAGAPSFPPRPACGTPQASIHDSWCAGVEDILLSKDVLVDASGDGRVAPGEEASIAIVVTNQGATFFQTPCVGLLSSNPDVTILGGAGGNNPAFETFGILSGQSQKIRLKFRFGSALVPGQTVRFMSWLDINSAGCENGNQIEFDVRVE